MNLQKSGFFLTAFLYHRFWRTKSQIGVQTSKWRISLKVINGTEIQELFCRGARNAANNPHSAILEENLYLRGSIPVSLQSFFIRKEGE